MLSTLRRMCKPSFSYRLRFELPRLPRPLPGLFPELVSGLILFYINKTNVVAMLLVLVDTCSQKFRCSVFEGEPSDIALTRKVRDMRTVRMYRHSSRARFSLRVLGTYTRLDIRNTTASLSGRVVIAS